MVTVIKKGTPLEEVRKIIRMLSSKSKKDIRQFAGTLKIEADPLEIQKKMRDEWG